MGIFKKIGMMLAVICLMQLTVKAEEKETGNIGTYTIFADSSRVFDIEEVVVVSQPKESFRLRMQPLSSTSFSQQQLTSLGVQDLRELSAYIPSFTMPNYGSRLTSSIYVRGIGSRVNSPAVGIYVDGMPIQNKSAFNFHMYDIDRVDVLRGPQGTLYGMNTEGGLIRMYTKNPFDVQGTDVKISLGSHFWRKTEVSHYQKVNNRFACSLAGFYDGQNGFFKNTYDGSHADDFNEAGARARFLFRPNDRWQMEWVNDYQYVNQHGFPYGLLNIDTQTAEAPQMNVPGLYRRNLLNTGFHLNYNGRCFDFTSTTSYQFQKDYMQMDVDYTALDKTWIEQRQLKNGLTQELVLKSRDCRFWHWTSGVFGSYEWLKTNAPVHFGADVINPIVNGIYTAMNNSMLRRFTPEQIERMGGISMSGMMDVPGLFHTPTTNLGVFHESNFQLADRLTATFGLRYDYSHVQIDYETSAIMAITANVFGVTQTNALTSLLDHHAHDHFNQLLPKFGINYVIDRHNSNLYAAVSKGYRAGGYNIQMFSDILQTEFNNPENRNKVMRQSYDIPHTDEDYQRINHTISYKPETSWNYEVGAHLNLFGNAMHADLAAYYTQIRNQQLSVMAGNYGYGRAMVNAGKSYSCGFEAALRGNMIDNHLNYALSYGFTHAAFKEYIDEETLDDGSTIVVDYKDKHVPFIPQHTFAASADYRFELAMQHFRSIVLGVNVTGQGPTYWDEANFAKENVFALLGAHADMNFEFSSCRFLLSLWGRNLTNTKYNVFAFPINGPTSPHFAQQGNGIQVGFDVVLTP